LKPLPRHERFTEQDLPFLQTLADLIALAIDRARRELLADAVASSGRRNGFVRS
jgi:GAF domain-containing protein